MTINTTPTSHPRSCNTCHGTGWTYGQPCHHHWADDEPTLDEPCTFTHGIQTAWPSYVEECERLGREPNRGRFEHWI